jgi:hypothetical protein
MQKPEGKRLLGRPSENEYWIHLAKDTDQRLSLVSMVINLQLPCRGFLDQLSDYQFLKDSALRLKQVNISQLSQYANAFFSREKIICWGFFLKHM